MRKLVTQDKLDSFWHLYEGGVTDHADLARRCWLSGWSVQEIIRENRRIARNCDAARKATAIATLHTILNGGVTSLYEAAKQAGLTYTDAARERQAYLKNVNNYSHRNPLKPRHVTAAEFTGEWYDQQDEAFCKAMRREHPEMATETI